MKESISYSFLLNIIILFIFVCFAIVMGIFSYYKAFRANTIISETIEKYEGFNCVSKEEIARKLNNLGYNTPFNVKCKSSDGNCETDSETDGNYKVISYNLDFSEGDRLVLKQNGGESTGIAKNVYGEEMNSSYVCFEGKICTTNKRYQYGIYTYMYVDMPVISSLLKLSYFSKTNPLYEFRNFYVEQSTDTRGNVNTLTTDVETLFSGLYSKKAYPEDVYFGTSSRKINGMYYTKDTYLGTITVVDYDNNGTAITSTNETANKVLAESVLGAYTKLNAISDVSKKNSYKWEDLLTDINKISGKNLRARAGIMNLASSNGGSIDASLTTSIKKGGLPRNECGYVRNYEDINNEFIYK